MFLIHNAKKTLNTTSVYALNRVSPERLVAGFHLKLDQLVEETKIFSSGLLGTNAVTKISGSAQRWRNTVSTRFSFTTWPSPTNVFAGSLLPDETRGVPDHQLTHRLRSALPIQRVQVAHSLIVALLDDLCHCYMDFCDDHLYISSSYIS